MADASEGFDVMTLGNGTYLDRIIAQHRKRASADQRSLADLQRAVKDRPPPRKFLRALEAVSYTHLTLPTILLV